MLNPNPAQAVEHLSTFDREEFGLWISGFGIPRSYRVEFFRIRAAEHTEEAEALLDLASEYNAKGDADSHLMASALLEGVKIRMAAATQCQEMSWSSAFIRGLETAR